MSVVNRMRRVEGLEEHQSPGNLRKVYQFQQHPDGTVDGPTPASISPGGIILKVVGIPAREGRPYTREEMDHEYPGWEKRLDESNARYAGKVTFRPVFGGAHE